MGGPKMRNITPRALEAAYYTNVESTQIPSPKVLRRYGISLWGTLGPKGAVFNFFSRKVSTPILLMKRGV